MFTDEDGKVTHERITNRGGKFLTTARVLTSSGKLFVENLMEEYDSWKKLIIACKSVWNFKKYLPDSPYDSGRKRGFT